MSGTVAEYAPTLANLMTAFEGESNANARYTVFAAKADADGWHGAASLFRAAARAEQIHAANHAKTIKKLGGEAHCEIHPVESRSTLQNLKVALAGEQHEIDSMYPAFILEAGNSDVTAAMRTFTWALEAEKSHATLFREAIELVAEGVRGSWVGSQREFYVCTTCGYTSDTKDEETHCPVCNLAWERFEIIR